MLKYIAVSGFILSTLFVLSEMGVTVFGNMIKTKRETGVSIEIQVANAIKKSENKIK
ncbi:hypothetical protein CAR_c12010 [Carnobacterium sp. 17-4]|uniref:hypothetical protein n=1 Tax=Carnobacterium sp. (strain 17-4) TaxID=208596 RepID=UPI00020584FC|nr:hypothetical protein [Carnobacterium sp. 17-4]AEB29893.1 hypothetical protein CAR_c12010 [Carnobacterium sp. 17-4]